MTKIVPVAILVPVGARCIVACAVFLGGCLDLAELPAIGDTGGTDGGRRDAGREGEDAGRDAGREGIDAGRDAGREGIDAGRDAGREGIDAGPVGIDAGPAGIDAGPAGIDAGRPDAGTPGTDAGRPDTGPPGGDAGETCTGAPDGMEPGGGGPCNGVDDDGDCAVDEGDDCVVDLALGRAHSCALRTDDIVYCWGDNSQRQLGTPAVPLRPDAEPVVGASGISAIAAGADHVCAVQRAGRGVLCWGSNTSGQIGNPSLGVARATPGVVSRAGGGALTGVDQLAAGDEHTCARVAGQVLCWGSNLNGQLGLGSTATSTTHEATAVPGLAGVRQIAAGARHTCAVLGAGAVHCWGDDSSGAVSGTMGVNVLSPTAVTIPGTCVFDDVAAGDGHTCAVRNGSATCLACWGADHFGQVGDDPDPDPIVAPVMVGGFPRPRLLRAGGGFTFALSAGGTDMGGDNFACWGDNGREQMGHAGAPGIVTPPSSDCAHEGGDLMDTSVVLDLGHEHACAAIGFSGDVTCWGANDRSQAGDGSSTGPRETPFDVFVRP